jgi:3-hydroxyisobutyrate dehydrogenase
MTTVAVLGTGIMGFPMARNIAQAGHTVRAWNRSRDKAAPLTGHGVTVLDSAPQAVEDADLVVTMLTDVNAVIATMTDDVLKAFRPDAVWLQMSTVGVEGTRRLAELARQHGIAYIDAPVSGTRKPAEDGQLAVLAAGDPALREKAQPVFDAVGASRRWVGDEPGNATALKLVLNGWVLTVTDGVSEALSLTGGLGLDPQLFLDAITGGSLEIGYAFIKGPVMISGDYAPSFPAALAAKDADLIMEAASAVGVPLSVIPAVRDDLRYAIAEGHANDDMATMHLAHRRH